MATHAVLTDSHWLQEITRFQDGLPGLICDFQRTGVSNQADVNIEPPVKRADLVRAAIAAQDRRVLAMLERLAPSMSDISFDDALMLAAQLGRFESLRWLVMRWRQQKKPLSTVSLLDGVVGGCGDVDTAVWVAVHCPDSSQLVSSAALDRAAASGHLEILQWLDDSKHFESAFQATAMDNAAASGHVEILTFLYNHRHEGCTPQAPIAAAKGGHLDVLELLFEWYPHHFASTPEILDAATLHNRLAIVRFLHETTHAPCSVAAIDNAAANGDLEVVEYLLKHRNEGFSCKALTSAARAGNVPMLRLLLEHHERPESESAVPLTRAITAAAQPGHTAVVQLLLEAHKGESRPNAAAGLRVAAAWGHIDVVRLLLMYGEWRSLLDPITQASYQGHDEIVELLKQAVRDRHQQSD